jgi:hypothetical protein
VSTKPLDSDLNAPLPSVLPAIPDEAVEHGEVFTRPWIVEMILDLVDYTADRDLAPLRLVEPACGEGAFLSVIASRVSESCRKHDRSIIEAKSAVTAFDLLEKNVEASQRTIFETLISDGWHEDESTAIAASWVRQGDYLFQPRDESVDVVVGNPPYVRLEDVPNDRMSEYRARWSTMTGRADLYVGFFEAALASLRPGGSLGFICADRWMRNQYGRSLRELIGDSYAMTACILMHDVDAFQEQVAAYPAITIVKRKKQETAVVADTTSIFDAGAAQEITSWIQSKNSTSVKRQAYEASRLPRWFAGSDFWPAGSPAKIAILEDLTSRFPALGDPEAGVRVGIGVATGADKVFITRDDDAVEPDRLLRLSMVRDTTSGVFEWSKNYLINPWDDNGKLVDLKKHPRLAAYFEEHREALARRYIAKRNPHTWYKTIDKVDHRLTDQPKLLFPDMKLTSHPVLEKGGFYPHHNLYYLTSKAWDLEVLGGLLLSKVAEAFIDAYTVKMRGKTLRFQAQYLRRIRIPHPAEITQGLQERFAQAFRERDTEAATQAALEAYGIGSWPS